MAEVGMTLSRADFANGYANMYNEFGKKIHSFPCSRLVGYGPNGIVVERSTLIVVIDTNCRQRVMPQFQFSKEQWQLHDDFMQVRC